MITVTCFSGMFPVFFPLPDLEVASSAAVMLTIGIPLFCVFFVSFIFSVACSLVFSRLLYIILYKCFITRVINWTELNKICHQRVNQWVLYLSSLLSKRLYAMKPSFLMCTYSGSMFSIISKLIWGVVLVRLEVKRQASLFKLFSFWWSILVLIIFPHVRQAYVNFGLITPVKICTYFIIYMIPPA